MRLPSEPISLPVLPYSYDGLTPVISVDQLKTHYSGHHRTYVETYNRLLQDKSNSEDHIVNLEFNFFGHLLHSLFWQNLTTQHSTKPTGKFLAQLNSQSSVEKLFKDIIVSAGNIHGSGWIVVAADNRNNEIVISTISNHDIGDLLNYRPLLVLDAWEHSYYIDYKNKKNLFFESLLTVVNWDVVERRFIK